MEKLSYRSFGSFGSFGRFRQFRSFAVSAFRHYIKGFGFRQRTKQVSASNLSRNYDNLILAGIMIYLGRHYDNLILAGIMIYLGRHYVQKRCLFSE